MAGDLLLTNLDEDELNVLLEAGGALVSTIFHSDKYAQNHWNGWMGRLQEGLLGGNVNNRVGLPPHFYVTFKLNTYKGAGNHKFSKIIWASLRPLTIVSNKQALANWQNNKTASDAEAQFRAALQTSALTLEIYNYEGKDLIDRNTGQVHADLAYMTLAPE